MTEKDDTNERRRMFIHDRWSAIVRLLNPNNVTSVEDLAQQLNVSLATVRRDLSDLHDAGRIRRVRGGAISLDGTSPSLKGQAFFDISATTNSTIKRAIGHRAASIVEDGEAIIIDGGTTTLELAKSIAAQNLTVLTTSVPILVALLGRQGLRVVITGGEVFEEQGIVLNPYGDGIVHRFSGSKLFIGAQAISADGLMQTDPLLVQNEQDLIKRAEQIIVLADSSKFEERGSLSVCDLSRIDTLITDTNIRASDRQMLEDHDVNVVLVSAPK